MKCRYCVICGQEKGTVQFIHSQQIDRYTSLCIRLLIPLSKKHRFLDTPKLQFCVNCVLILEYIENRKSYLEEISRYIKKAEAALKYKLSQPRQVDEPVHFRVFRELATEDFPPEIEMSMDNSRITKAKAWKYPEAILSLKDKASGGSGSETPQESTLMLTQHEIPWNSLPTQTNSEIRSQNPQVGSNETIKSATQIVSRSPISLGNNSKPTKTPAEDNGQVYLCALKLSRNAPYPKVFRNYRVPQGLLEPDGPIMDLTNDEEEEVAEDPPDNNQEENVEKNAMVVAQSSSSELQGNTYISSGSDDEVEEIFLDEEESTQKTWPRPPLTFSQMCIMAIKCAATQVISFDEIYKFFMENFPYFQQRSDYWKRQIRLRILTQRYFIQWRSSEHNTEVFSVVEDEIVDLVRITLKHLNSKSVHCSMAFPERVFDIRLALVTKIKKRTTCMDATTMVTKKTQAKAIAKYQASVQNTVLSGPRNSSQHEQSSSRSRPRGTVFAQAKQDVCRFKWSSLTRLRAKEYPMPRCITIPTGGATITIYCKPELSFKEMCFVAIMDADSMLASESDVLEFMKAHFPYYTDAGPSTIMDIKTTLNTGFFKVFGCSKSPRDWFADARNSSYCVELVYTIQDNPSLAWRKQVASNLVDSMIAMPHPERVHDFIKKVTLRCIVPNMVLYLKYRMQRNMKK